MQNKNIKIILIIISVTLGVVMSFVSLAIAPKMQSYGLFKQNVINEYITLTDYDSENATLKIIDEEGVQFLVNFSKEPLFTIKVLNIETKNKQVFGIGGEENFTWRISDVKLTDDEKEKAKTILFKDPRILDLIKDEKYELTVSEATEVTETGEIKKVGATAIIKLLGKNDYIIYINIDKKQVTDILPLPKK